MAKKQRTVAAVLEADSSRYRREMRRAGTESTQFARKIEGVGRRLRNAMRNTGIGNVSQSLKGLAASAAAFAGVAGIGATIKSVMDFDDALTELMITGNETNKWMADQRKKIIDISNRYGKPREEIASFALKFVELTGDANGAMEMLEDMTKVGVAFGANMADLATMMENLIGSFRLTTQEGGKAMAILRQISKLGTIGFKDMARLLPQVSAAAGKFGESMKGLEGLKTVGAVLQIAKWTTKGPAEAGTASARFFDVLASKREKIEEVLGIQMRGAGGKWMPMNRILQALGSSMQDVGKADRLQKIFPAEMSGKVLAALKDAFGGGKRAQTFGLMMGATGAGQISGDLEKRLAAAGQKWRLEMNKLSNELYNKFLPVLKKLIVVLPTLAKLAGWLVNNLERIGAAWALWKGTKFFQGLMQISSALGGAGGMGGLGGRMGAGPLGTMTVTAQIVNVMGKAGIPGATPGVPGVPGTGIPPHATRHPGQALPTPMERRAFTPMQRAAMGVPLLGALIAGRPTFKSMGLATGETGAVEESMIGGAGVFTERLLPQISAQAPTATAAAMERVIPGLQEQRFTKVGQSLGFADKELLSFVATLQQAAAKINAAAAGVKTPSQTVKANANPVKKSGG